ncbi:DNA damage-inducible protein D [Candidatus Woesearchaeota archaeon]|nr:DNA damage-inducible protein D [Candidatus Woesearchaeota archaeon]
MKKELIFSLRTSFEEASQTVDGIEYWFARDLQKLLEYEQWRNFLNVVEKAKIACENSDQKITDHFADVSKLIPMGKGASRDIEDLMLTRYACYLIAQNGDPRKDQIAFAQSYFAIQTRKQELIEERIALIERLNARKKLAASESELSKLIFERGVDEQGFARIRSKGDQALFGGITTIDMKKKLGVPHNRPVADFLPTITITAKNLATEITNFNVQKENLHGEPHITQEHVKNNKDVRGLLGKSGIQPENLPPEQDIKKLQRKTKSEEKLIAENSRKKGAHS